MGNNEDYMLRLYRLGWMYSDEEGDAERIAGEMVRLSDPKVLLKDAREYVVGQKKLNDLYEGANW